MRSKVKLSTLAFAFLLLGGTAYAAVQSWRPGMPAFLVDIHTADGVKPAPALILIYSEVGRDPYFVGTLGSGQRIASCRTVGSRCVSSPARGEFAVQRDRLQSLQVRLFNANGNPIVGGFQWRGPWHPYEVRVTCDLRIPDAKKSCFLSGLST